MMEEMTLLKALYTQQETDSAKMNQVTSDSVGISHNRFDEAITSLNDHGYLTSTDLCSSKVTTKGCRLAKEL